VIKVGHTARTGGGGGGEQEEAAAAAAADEGSLLLALVRCSTSTGPLNLLLVLYRSGHIYIK